MVTCALPLWLRAHRLDCQQGREPGRHRMKRLLCQVDWRWAAVPLEVCTQSLLPGPALATCEAVNLVPPGSRAQWVCRHYGLCLEVNDARIKHSRPTSSHWRACSTENSAPSQACPVRSVVQPQQAPTLASVQGCNSVICSCYPRAARHGRARSATADSLAATTAVGKPWLVENVVLMILCGPRSSPRV